MPGLTAPMTAFLVAAAIWPRMSHAETAAELSALKGLAPVTTLAHTAEGQAALDANFRITGAIQTGATPQALLLPKAAQQQSAIKDAFITGRNAAQLADGLGTRLGTAYQALAQYRSAQDYTNITAEVGNLLAYTAETTARDANVAKFFFANATTNGIEPVSDQARAILQSIDGITDPFGLAYHLPGGSPGGDRFGNSRPFQTEPTLATFSGSTYFGVPTDNLAYLRGPEQDLRDSPSYPSGHATYGTTDSLLLALLIPARYPQEIARAAEYGNNRIILGAHYAMDVIGGRTLALYDVAHLLANDPAYVGQPRKQAPVIADYQRALQAARVSLVAALQDACGDAIESCAAIDIGRFADPQADRRLVEATLTYGLPVVHVQNAHHTEDVAAIAPEAGYLLTSAFPGLTLAAANAILTATEGEGGGFLDNGSAFGVYSRLNLYAAARRAGGVEAGR